MLTIPQYLIESSFCLAIFYGFYHFFLKKETFFQLNRAYLLCTPIAALSIPLLNITFKKDAPPESLEAFFYPAIQSANNLNEVVWEQMRAPSPVFSLSVADVIMAVYFIGIFLMSFSLLKGLWNLGRIIRRGKRSKNNDFTLVETKNNFPAASFFGYIFWNQQITDEQKLILEHEKVHIRQWHSLDVLLMEICVIIKWFNPLIYWFRNALKATHEFIADQYVIEQKSNVGDYATLLVNQHKKQVAAPLTNTFYSLTKKRLKMMIQQPSQKVNGVKYLFIFPLFIGLMSLFSFNLLEEIPQVSKGLAEMNSVLEDIGDKTVFEIDKPYLTEDSPLLSQAEKITSDYEIHLGDFKYNAGIATKFNSLTHKNEITLREIQSFLDNPILFMKEEKKLDLIKIDLVIPNPNVSYSTTHRSTTVGTEGQENAFIIEASKTADFKFSKPAINAFLKMIHDGSNFYINGYGTNEVFIGEFLVNYAEGEVSNKEMDSYFYFPTNPTKNRIKVGQKEISLRGLKTGGTAAPARINKANFFKSLREGDLIFMQNGQPLVLDELYLTHATDKNNYTANIVKNANGQFEILTSFDSPPLRLKANKTEGVLFSETDIKAIEDNIQEFDLIEFRGKNKEDSFLKTVFFAERTLRYNRNHNFESSAENPIFDIPSLINNKQLKFKWGNIELPIWHSNNPHFKGKPRLQISTEQFIENLTAEMMVLDNHKIFDIQSMSLDFVFYNNKEKNDPEYIYTPPIKLLFQQGDEMKLLPPNQETLTKYINNFGKVYINIPKLGDFHSVVIEVGKNGRPIPKIPEEEAIVYGYQVIMPKYKKAGKTVLRIDTTMTKNKRIVDMYRNPERYHIIHIPDFRTDENLLWEDTEQIIKEELNSRLNHENKKKEVNKYQLKWGNYTFNCQEKNVENRKICACEGLYINKADLAKMNNIGIQFLKNETPIEFDNVYVSANGHVYCEKEDLMINSDLQITYNPDACIWNAFDEGERGNVRFQTEDFDKVSFTFAINSKKGQKRMENSILTIGKKTFSLPHFSGIVSERTSFTFEQVKGMVGERVQFTHLGETAKIKDIKIQVASNKLKYTFQSLNEKGTLERLKDFYPPDKVFYLGFEQEADSTFNLYLSLHPSDDIFKKHANEFTWGDYSFGFKNPFLALTKKELTKLIQEQDMKNYLGNPIEKVTGVKFLYADETIRYFGKKNNYDFKNMFREQAFKENYNRLKAGDLINIMNLHSNFVKGGLTIFIKENANESTSYFDIQPAKGLTQNQFKHPFITLYRNHSIATVVAELLDIHPSKLRFQNKESLPKVNLTYKPLAGVDAKNDLLEKIKKQYPFVIKKKILEQEAWFLSAGDTEKLAKYEQRKILGRQFESVKRKNFEKGLETLGPVKFDWFATTYFKRNHQIDVINLTDFSGKYILPLDTASFAHLQAQMERDFGLVLKKQRRSMEIKEVIFE